MTSQEAQDAQPVVSESSFAAEAAELGPFAPPDDFRFPEVFAEAPPRAIPPAVRRSSYERRHRGRTLNVFFIGVACLVASSLPPVVTLSYYILPLGYLDWIGIGLLAIAALMYGVHAMRPGRYAYIRDGSPQIARVRQIGVTVSGTKEAPEFGFAVEVDAADPNTGQLSVQTVDSGRVGAAREAERYSLGLVPGQYTTLVSLPGRPAQIYGLMGIDPEHELILKDGKPPAVISPFAALLITAAVVAVVGVLVAGIYALEFSSPIDGDLPRPLVIAAGVGAAIGGAVALALWLRGPAPRSLKNGAVSTMLSMFGGVMLAAVTALTLNAQLDRSPPEYREVEVANFWQTTWSFLIRDYDIEYRELSDAPQGKTHKFPARITDMERFFDARAGVLEIGHGWLGIRWGRGLHPVELRELAPGEEHEGTTLETTLTDSAGNTRPAQFALVVTLADGSELDPSEALAERAVKSLRGELPLPGSERSR